MRFVPNIVDARDALLLLATNNEEKIRNILFAKRNSDRQDRIDVGVTIHTPTSDAISSCGNTPSSQSLRETGYKAANGIVTPIENCTTTQEHVGLLQSYSKERTTLETLNSEMTNLHGGDRAADLPKACDDPKQQSNGGTHNHTNIHNNQEELNVGENRDFDVKESLISKLLQSENTATAAGEMQVSSLSSSSSLNSLPRLNTSNEAASIISRPNLNSPSRIPPFPSKRAKLHVSQLPQPQCVKSPNDSYEFESETLSRPKPQLLPIQATNRRLTGLWKSLRS
eukprot:gene1863-4960_t